MKKLLSIIAVAASLTAVSCTGSNKSGSIDSAAVLDTMHTTILDSSAGTQSPVGGGMTDTGAMQNSNTSGTGNTGTPDTTGNR